jgi:hypothetical protein
MLRFLTLAVLTLAACTEVPPIVDGGAPFDGGSLAGDAGRDSGVPFDGGVAADSGVTTDSGVPGAKSAKRGIAYDFATSADLAAVSGGVSWWYNWSTTPNPGLPATAAADAAMDYLPMLWNGNFTASSVQAWLAAHPGVHWLLVMNEPNLTGQSNLTPQAAAAIWPRYEALASAANVQVVGPQITWGTMPNFQDPVVWLDAFYAAYRGANGGRDPHIDALGFHWYDYGLAGQLDRLTKYGKPFWVTEFSNWHAQNDGAQIDSLAKQKTQLTELVSVCEGRADVIRYAWFTGRVSPDPHFDSLLAADGKVTELGQLYLSLPH